MVSTNRSTNRRRGFSYLELQVSLVLFAIAMGGVVPLSVVHSRQVRQMENRFAPRQRHRLLPAESVWQRKLGAAARIVDVFPTPQGPNLLIDDGAAGYSQINHSYWDWYHWTWSRGYDGDLRLNYLDRAGDKATWTFAGLIPGRYRVLITYQPLWYLASDARYRIYDGERRLKEVKVDQRQAPDGPLLDGWRWKVLDTVDIKGETLRLELDDHANRYYIQVDAARLLPVENDLRVLDLRQEDETNASAYVRIKVRVK